MKALTLYPEWAAAICFLKKDVENRSWSPPKNLIGNRFAIHSGSIIGKSQNKDLLYKLKKYNIYTSSIVATVTLADVIRNSNSKWAVPGYYHWLLKDIQILKDPIYCKGKLRLWEL